MPADSPADRYLALIDQIVQATLKGQIRAKEQVYQMLVSGVETGTGELFERSLFDRITTTQRLTETQTDELKQAKATRSLRALQTIQGEWQRWQTQNQTSALLDRAIRQISQPETEEVLLAWLRITDPNLPQPLSLAQWQQLAKQLQQVVAEPAIADSLQALATGVLSGLEEWSRLENDLVSWIYEPTKAIGFEGMPNSHGPWATWAKPVQSPLLRSLFETVRLGDSVSDWVQQQTWDLGEFVAIASVIRCLQQGLVNWFDKLVYDSKVGAKLSISTFLSFAVIWSQLASGFLHSNPPQRSLASGCFQLTLQILRTFAQRSYFPLYGGVFASFSGDYLRNAMSYLDEPLRQAEGTEEKARILTLLGYSARVLGQTDRSVEFHQQALEIARAAEDRPCEIANLNHLSRSSVAQTRYAEAINYSQRAVILSRQAGDRLGEANALANLGYSEVLQAQQLEQADPDLYEMSIDRLQQGLELSERLGDRQSQALCFSSLGIAHLMLDQPQTALTYLEGGVQAAQFSGDVYLQGLNLAHSAEAYYRLQNNAKFIHAACLGMYLLEQIGSNVWRQPAGLLTIVRGKLGEAEFEQLLAQQRASLIAAIGVDGYDHLPELLKQY